MNSFNDGSAESIAALSFGLISSRFAATYALELPCEKTNQGRRGEETSVEVRKLEMNAKWTT